MRVSAHDSVIDQVLIAKTVHPLNLTLARSVPGSETNLASCEGMHSSGCDATQQEEAAAAAAAHETQCVLCSCSVLV
jgi:hypothetical protein